MSNVHDPVAPTPMSATLQNPTPPTPFAQTSFMNAPSAPLQATHRVLGIEPWMEADRYTNIDVHKIIYIITANINFCDYFYIYLHRNWQFYITYVLS